eukprot:COSAG02_NODE_5080_length_4658_cov_10.089274_3_plen_760_part_00
MKTKLDLAGVHVPFLHSGVPEAVPGVVQVSKPPWLQLGMVAHGWTPEMILERSTRAHFQWIQAEATSKLIELKARSQSPDGTAVSPTAGTLVKQMSDEIVERAVHSSNADSSAAGPPQHDLEQQKADSHMKVDHGTRKQQASVDKLDVDKNRSQTTVDEVGFDTEPTRGAADTVEADGMPKTDAWQEESAAILIQGQFRRIMAVRKRSVLRRLNAKHNRLHEMQCAKQNANAVFSHIDASGDTVIDLDEISSAVEKAGSNLEPSAVVDAIASIVSEDGSIAKEDFEQWWSSHSELRAALFGSMLTQIQSHAASHGVSKEWTIEDSVAGMMQSCFRMRNSRKTVRRAANFISKATPDGCKLDVDRKRFDEFDTDGTGQLDLREMTALMETLGFKADDGSARFMLEKYDDDGDGTISYEEFKKLWAGIGLLGGEDVIDILRKTDRSDEDLAKLRERFSFVPFMHSLDTEMKKLQAASYLTLHSCPCGTTLFKEGDVGDTMYILLSGSAECVVMGVAGTTVSLECGPGDCVGEQSLRGENNGRRDATLQTLEDTRFAAMSRSDYLRVTGSFTTEVLRVLALPHGRDRSYVDLKLVRSFFAGTRFFNALHFSLLQYRCCNYMTLVQRSPDKILYQQNQKSDSVYIVLQGCVGAFRKKAGVEEERQENNGKGTFVQEYTAGMVLGENTVTGKINAKRRRTETIATRGSNKATLARLLATNYVEVTDTLESTLRDILRLKSWQRKPEHIDLLCEFFEGEVSVCLV